MLPPPALVIDTRHRSLRTHRGAAVVAGWRALLDSEGNLEAASRVLKRRQNGWSKICLVVRRLRGTTTIIFRITSAHLLGMRRGMTSRWLICGKDSARHCGGQMTLCSLRAISNVHAHNCCPTLRNYADRVLRNATRAPSAKSHTWSSKVWRSASLKGRRPTVMA